MRSCTVSISKLRINSLSACVSIRTQTLMIRIVNSILQNSKSNRKQLVTLDHLDIRVIAKEDQLIVGSPRNLALKVVSLQEKKNSNKKYILCQCKSNLFLSFFLSPDTLFAIDPKNDFIYFIFENIHFRSPPPNQVG